METSTRAAIRPAVSSARGGRNATAQLPRARRTVGASDHYEEASARPACFMRSPGVNASLCFPPRMSARSWGLKRLHSRKRWCVSGVGLELTGRSAVVDDLPGTDDPLRRYSSVRPVRCVKPDRWRRPAPRLSTRFGQQLRREIRGSGPGPWTTSAHGWCLPDARRNRHLPLEARRRGRVGGGRSTGPVPQPFSTPGAAHVAPEQHQPTGSRSFLMSGPGW